MSRNVAVPYLTVADGAGALEFYREAFGAVEQMRVVMDDAGGALGHASFRIGDAEFYLSDEFVEMGVTAPPTIGGTTVAIHLHRSTGSTRCTPKRSGQAQSLCKNRPTSPMGRGWPPWSIRSATGGSSPRQSNRSATRSTLPEQRLRT